MVFMIGKYYNSNLYMFISVFNYMCLKDCHPPEIRRFPFFTSAVMVPDSLSSIQGQHTMKNYIIMILGGMY